MRSSSVEPELVPQLVHALLELHERAAEALDLVVGQAAAVDAPQRLALHQLAQQLDHREHELREAALDGSGSASMRRVSASARPRSSWANRSRSTSSSAASTLSLMPALPP